MLVTYFLYNADDFLYECVLFQAVYMRSDNKGEKNDFKVTFISLLFQWHQRACLVGTI